MKIRNLLVFSAFLGLTIRAWSQGYIVPNGVTPGGVTPWGAYQFNVVRDPFTSFSTGFYLTPRGIAPPSSYTNTFQFASFIDVGVRVFLVGENDPISEQTLLGNNYTELLMFNNYTFADGVPFYLAVYTGNQNSAPPDGVYTDPLFGWAWMMNNRGIPQLLDGALTYNAPGIYAGTTTIIPEPSAFSLFGLGALLLGWYSSRKVSR